MAEERLEEIRQSRLQKRQLLIDAGQVPYPSEVKRTHITTQALSDFDKLTEDGTPITLAGRLTGLRSHGGVVFMDLTDGEGALQLQLTKSDVPVEIFDRIGTADVGDFIQAVGSLTKTQRGVPTLNIKEWHIISKSIRPLPSAHYGLKDKESRFRRREVDFLINPEARELVLVRSKVIAWLRNAFIKEGFLEVETPILQPIAGGTTATPFTTHHEALDSDLYLRIAPELYLKRLLVGGFERVFEIGRNFRNEGVDREHNPEFTMLEAYWSYVDYEDLMDFLEKTLSQLVRDIAGKEPIPRGDSMLDFSTPWKRERYVDIVSQAIGFDILEEKDLAKYEEVLKERGLELPAVRTYPKLVDEFYKEVVRPTLVQPTFIYDFPVEIEPLAKQNATDPRVVERFQLVIAGTELLKAYSELNDPVIQLQRFEEQQAARAAGDKEIGEVDTDYVEAMEYGMPPAAGVGIGIDRLVWLITNAGTLRDTIAFPLLKTER